MSGVVEWVAGLGVWSAPLWLPVLIWTVVAAIALVGLVGFRRSHPVIQEKARTALLVALPVGVLVATLNVVGWVSVPQTSVPVSEWVAGVGGGLPAGPAALGSRAPVESPAGPPRGFWWGVLFLGVVGATGVAATRTVRDVVELRRLRARLRDLGPNDLGFDPDAETGEGRRAVRIGAIADDVVPMTFGVFRPVVVVPERLMDDRRALRLAIAHELVHIRRGDVLVHTIEHLTTLLFAFHPLVHWLRVQTQRYREMACDAEVIGSGRCRPDEYAGLLLRLASPGAAGPAAALGVGGTFTHLKMRIMTMQKNNHIASGPARRAGWLIGLAVAATTVFAVACTDLVTEPGAEPVTRGQVEFSAASFEAALGEAESLYGGRLLVYFRSPEGPSSAAVERHLFGNPDYAQYLADSFARYTVPVDTDEALAIMERYNVTSRTDSPLLLLVDDGSATLMTTLDDVDGPEMAARKMGQVRATLALRAMGLGGNLNLLAAFREMEASRNQ